MVARSKVEEFVAWHQIDDKGMRLGQHFIGTFYQEIRHRMPDPELFHETRWARALEIIEERYTDA